VEHAMGGVRRGLLHSGLLSLAVLVVLATAPLSSEHSSSLPIVGNQAGNAAEPGEDDALRTPDDPVEALLQAERLLAAGSSALAARVVAPVLGASDPVLRVRARLLLARAMLAGGDAAAALELAAAVARQASATRETGLALVIAGEALLARGQPGQAAEEFLAARALLPEIAPYLEYRALDPLVQAGRAHEAEALVEQIVATAPLRRLAVAALEWRRAWAEQRGDLPTLAATLDRLLELATIPSYRASLLLQRGRVEQQRGDAAAARADFARVIDEAPASPAAALALDELAALGVAETVPIERRAAILFSAGRYREAVTAFTALLASDPTRAEAWYQRAIARVRAGDLAEGIEELTAMADRYPQDARAPDALVTAAMLLEWRNEPAAEVLYRRVLSQYPGTVAARQARFRLGLLAFARGAHDEARDLWRADAEAGDPRAAYWYGKALAASGEPVGARAWWSRAYQRDPNSFWGQRAADLLSGRTTILQQPVAPLSLDSEADVVLAWLDGRGENLAAAREEIEKTAAPRRALLLLDAGLREAAGWEVDAARTELRDRPVSLAVFGWLLLERGEAAYAYRIGGDLATDERVPEQVRARLLAPIPYPEVLVAASEAFWNRSVVARCPDPAGERVRADCRLAGRCPRTDAGHAGNGSGPWLGSSACPVGIQQIPSVRKRVSCSVQRSSPSACGNSTGTSFSPSRATTQAPEPSNNGSLNDRPATPISSWLGFRTGKRPSTSNASMLAIAGTTSWLVSADERAGVLPVARRGDRGRRMSSALEAFLARLVLPRPASGRSASASRRHG
jgi:soluble lytic murein transglycosylase